MDYDTLIDRAMLEARHEEPEDKMRVFARELAKLIEAEIRDEIGGDA